MEDGMNQYVDLRETEFAEIHDICRPVTMTSTDRLYLLYNAVRFTVSSKVEGDLVECGVWKGGSVMMMALTLKQLGITDRNIYLFDTFEGMTPATDVDVDCVGASADVLMARGGRTENRIWAYSPIDEVRANLETTGYPMDRFIFVRGDVRDTIPDQGPEKI